MALACSTCSHTQALASWWLRTLFSSHVDACECQRHGCAPPVDTCKLQSARSHFDAPENQAASLLALSWSHSRVPHMACRNEIILPCMLQTLESREAKISTKRISAPLTLQVKHPYDALTAPHFVKVKPQPKARPKASQLLLGPRKGSPRLRWARLWRMS